MININDILNSSLLLLVLLNPFLVVVYLIDVMQKLSMRHFQMVLIRAGMISSAVFCIFALLGDMIFSNIIQAEFASFQIFGGVVFLLIGVQFIFKGGAAIEGLRGESKHVAGALAMPILIGPGTISYSVVIGERNNPYNAMFAILFAVFVSVGIMIIIKRLYDYIQPKKASLVERYFEISGRITALIVGTISIDMIMKGVRAWIEKF